MACQTVKYPMKLPKEFSFLKVKIKPVQSSEDYEVLHNKNQEDLVTKLPHLVNHYNNSKLPSLFCRSMRKINLNNIDMLSY